MRQILFVTSTTYLPGMVTGENVSTHALCKRLKADGHDPLVVCGREAGPIGRDAPPELGYTVLRLDDPMAAMLEIMDRLAPESVVICGAAAAFAAGESAAARARRLHLRFGAVSYRFAAPAPRDAPLWRYAVNSRFLVGFAEAFLGVPVAHVPSLIEPDDYRCEQTDDAILFVNPTAPKGVHLAAEIARRLPHRKFIFARSWPEHADFPHVGVSLPNIEWRPSTTDLRKLYAAAKLVLMPAILEEGWGRTVSEAQVSGIPAIASDRGGLPESVGPGGIVLSLGEPVERWCAEIESLFTDAARYQALSAAARRHAARAELAPARVTARFLEFLDS